MKLLNFNIIKLTFFLILGIIFAYVFPISIILSLSLTGFSFVLLCFSYLWQKNKLKQYGLFGILTLLTTFFIGISVYSLNNEKNYAHHYSNIQRVNSQQNIIRLKVCERLKPSLYHEKYVVEVLKLDSLSVSGKLLLNVSKDSLVKPYKVDAILQGKIKIDTISEPLNPYQFNYKNYLKKKQIYGQVYTVDEKLIQQKPTTTSIFAYANKLRDYINQKLEKYPFSKNDLALINALLLGQRQEISKETYESYANAGVIHILAISGLHIGIILLILNRIFNPIIYLKHGRIIKTVLLVVILWSFAIISGLSPSVTRAVTMFTVIAIAINYKRPTNIYNTLAISAFFILLAKPMFLFEVGFQLSYLAVFGIVSMQPKLYRIWRFPKKYWITNKLWEVLTVTLTAQLAIFPLTLFYFHRFPGLFFVTNLVIVPFLGIILFLGILVILSASLNILPAFLAHTYSYILNTMNLFVEWIASKEGFLFKHISFSWQELIVWYAVLIFFVLFLQKKNAKRFQYLLISVIIVQLSLIYKNYSLQNEELIIFHKSRHSIISKKVNRNATFYFNLKDLSNSSIINNYTTGSYIKTKQYKNLAPVYTINNQLILVIDSIGLYSFKTINPDYILLSNSPKINLNRLLDSLQPNTIIADGSNYKSYVKRWKATCINKKIPFHYTGEKGAFVVK